MLRESEGIPPDLGGEGGSLKKQSETKVREETAMNPLGSMVKWYLFFMLAVLLSLASVLQRKLKGLL